MKKRRTKLLALALSACLTVTAFSPVSAANETSVVSSSAEDMADAQNVDFMTEETAEAAVENCRHSSSGKSTAANYP